MPLVNFTQYYLPYYVFICVHRYPYMFLVSTCYVSIILLTYSIITTQNMQTYLRPHSHITPLTPSPPQEYQPHNNLVPDHPALPPRETRSGGPDCPRVKHPTRPGIKVSSHPPRFHCAQKIK